MNNDNIDKLAKECGLGSIYERPQPVEINGKLKWSSSGEITPFGHCLIRFVDCIKTLESDRLSDDISDCIMTAIKQGVKTGQLCTVEYNGDTYEYEPSKKHIKLTKKDKRGD